MRKIYENNITKSDIGYVLLENGSLCRIINCELKCVFKDKNIIQVVNTNDRVFILVNNGNYSKIYCCKNDSDELKVIVMGDIAKFDVCEMVLSERVWIMLLSSEKTCKSFVYRYDIEREIRYSNCGGRNIIDFVQISGAWCFLHELGSISVFGDNNKGLFGKLYDPRSKKYLTDEQSKKHLSFLHFACIKEASDIVICRQKIYAIMDDTLMLMLTNGNFHQIDNAIKFYSINNHVYYLNGNDMNWYLLENLDGCTYGKKILDKISNKSKISKSEMPNEDNEDSEYREWKQACDECFNKKYKSYPSSSPLNFVTKKFGDEKNYQELRLIEKDKKQYLKISMVKDGKEIKCCDYDQYNENFISLVGSGYILKKWDEKMFSLYCYGIKESIRCFINCLYRLRVTKNYRRLPKYMINEILKFMISL